MPNTECQRCANVINVLQLIRFLTPPTARERRACVRACVCFCLSTLFHEIVVTPSASARVVLPLAHRGLSGVYVRLFGPQANWQHSQTNTDGVLRSGRSRLRNLRTVKRHCLTASPACSHVRLRAHAMRARGRNMNRTMLAQPSQRQPAYETAISAVI